MTLLNYSVYAETISSAFFNTEKTYITQTLFGFLDDCPDIVNSKKEAFDISNQIASNWWNQKTPIPFNIRKGLQREAVVQIVINYFKNNLTTELSVKKLDTPLTRLVTLVKEQEINAASKAEILGYYKANNYIEFLAHTFILAVQQSNKKKTVDIDTVLKNKKSTPKGAITDEILTNDATNYNSQEVFKKYLDKAVDYFSKKKTVLNPEQPCDFDEIHVCNDIELHSSRDIDNNYNYVTLKPPIKNATISKLVSNSNYIIIQGTGGIGKSMFITRLFLLSVNDFLRNTNARLPIFIPLKDFKKETENMADFIWSAIKPFDSSITQIQILTELENGHIILFLDGLDEIQSVARESFDKNLESLIKAFPENTIIMTTRPINTFLSYTHFSLYDILPLTENQAERLINKLIFHNAKAKRDFKKALKNGLFHTHYEFASNPLLLTIMLMTYSYYGDIPAKMHTFYSQAYDAMARYHNETTGTQVRPFHTELTPEEFRKPFSEICARSYTNEVLDFTYTTFSSYLEKVLNVSPSTNKVTAKNFLSDLTEILCILYKEGDKYYFTHRSFQEYFAADYFSTLSETRLQLVGDYFEKRHSRSYFDRTFEMLYDMVPERIENFVFFPFLQRKFTMWNDSNPDETYWNFLEDQYPTIYYEKGFYTAEVSNEPQSFLYKFIILANNLQFSNHLLSSKLKIFINEKNTKFPTDLTLLNLKEWPDDIFNMPIQKRICVYSTFTKPEAYNKYPNPNNIPKSVLKEKTIINENDLPNKYVDYFGNPEIDGYRINIVISEIRKNPSKYATLKRFMSDSDFPFMKEFNELNKYYNNLQSRISKEKNSVNIFDD